MYPTAVLALINFYAFIAGSLYFGGDALNGYVQAGHHFLCAHGSCTEVSPAIWQYSYWHTLTAMGGILLVFVEAAVFITSGDIILDF
ncbi:MAG: hypothetical protein ACRETW_11060 [Stenotrophobium sp.]